MRERDMPAKKRYAPLVIRLEPDDVRLLAQIARAESRSVASLIRLAVREYLVRRLGQK